jgi:alpha-D-ribose 1-methylphosphonate 5-triphosphate diphosphatase
LAGAGITTHYAAVAFHWLTATLLRSEERAREIINTVHELRPRLLTDIRVHARFEITNVAAGPVLTDLMHTNQVHLVSLMDHTPGQGQYRDIEHYIQTMIVWRQTRGGQVVEEDDMREHVRNLQARPKGWDIVADVARIASAYGLPLASHDDDTPDKVEFMEGCGTSISEFPVTLEAAQAAKERGMHVAMGAPNALRGQSTSNNLSAQDGIAAGVVDILATDYHPASLLHAAHELTARGVLPLHAAVNLVSLNPAAALGLHDRGSLEIGKRADLSLVDMRDRPRVRATLRAGRQIYSDGTVCHA